MSKVFNNKLLWLSVTVSLWSLSARAQDRIFVNEYLNIGVGGRGLSMGGAQVASVNDVFSGYWNPSGLTQITDGLQLGGMHAEYFAGNAKYDFGSIAAPLKDRNRVIGCSIMRFATDDIPYTLDYVQPDGSFDESKLKSISAGDYAFIISYAQKCRLFRNPKIKTSFGINTKIIYRHIGTMANAWGGGVDAGLQIRGKRWQTGIMMKDITTTYTTWSFNLTERERQIFFQTGNEIPVKSYEVMKPRLNAGFAYHLLRPGKKVQLMVELNTDITTDGRRNTLISSGSISIDPHAGLELSLGKVVCLRAGISNIQKVKDDRDTTNQASFTLLQPSVGAGVQLGALMIDYAFTTLQTQRNPLFSHIVSVRFDYSRPKKVKK